MASRIVDMNYSTNYKDGTVFCDTINDLAEIDVEMLEQGAMAIIQSGENVGEIYTLLSTKKWSHFNP